ncbi:MAG: ABC transporter ATP-binding protein [Alphaproteobacteria bacterium]|nr:ABC transporter ATP-binding protein [Alphaproteobacteria bacterium]
MSDILLRAEGITKRYGGILACDNVGIELRAGETHAVIGPNGAGKTTLLAQLAGEIAPDSGRIHLGARDVTDLRAPERAALGLGRSFQITSVFREFTTRQNVALAVQAHDGHSFRFWRKARTDAALIEPARAMLDRLGLGDRAGVPAALLSHGEQRQLELAMALATKPRVLLLDEPMAGMGAADSERMTQLLSALKSEAALLLVEHDMDAVFALADRITVMTYGRVIATGTPAEIRANQVVRDAYLGADEAA